MSNTSCANIGKEAFCSQHEVMILFNIKRILRGNWGEGGTLIRSTSSSTTTLFLTSEPPPIAVEEKGKEPPQAKVEKWQFLYKKSLQYTLLVRNMHKITQWSFMKYQQHWLMRPMQGDLKEQEDPSFP